MTTGKVKFFDVSKGYGFLKCDQDNKDYFFHFSGMLDTRLDKDDVVEFEPGENKRGECAVKVRKM
jgi:CspA family cold shock protein